MSGDLEFSAALLDPDQPAPENLVAPDGGAAGSRFDVYRNNVTASLIEAMRVGFPVMEQLVGAKNFGTLALMYIRAHSPTSPVLMFYGAEFPEFVAGFAPLKDKPYMPDVAQLELTRREVYHAEDAPVFGAEDLQKVGEAAVMAGKLIPAPSTRIVTSYFPIQDIWLRNSGMPDHAISQVAQNVLLTRPDFDVQAYAITPDVAAFLNALSDATVGTVIEATLTANPDFPLGDALALILQSGFAKRLETDLT